MSRRYLLAGSIVAPLFLGGAYLAMPSSSDQKLLEGYTSAERLCLLNGDLLREGPACKQADQYEIALRARGIEPHFVHIPKLEKAPPRLEYTAPFQPALSK